MKNDDVVNIPRAYSSNFTVRKQTFISEIITCLKKVKGTVHPKMDFFLQ